jgi:fucose 4-O-acetylase-like acetyltransferase
MSIVAARNNAVSALRGIAIAMVVLGHINRGLLEKRAGTLGVSLNTLDFILYTVHMPVFFYLAGYFTSQSLTNRTSTIFAKSRWVAIVYPYLLWSVIIVAANFVLSSVVHINHIVPPSALSRIAWNPINILWFLYALLCMQLVAIVFRKHPYLLLVIALGASLVATLGASFFQANVAGKVGAHAPFFALGFALAAAGIQPIPVTIRTKWFAAAALAGWIATCLVAYTYGMQNPTTFALIPVSILGIAALASFSLIVTGSGKSVVGRHLAQMGDASLPIYLLHSFALALIPRTLRVLNVQSPLLELAAGLAIGVYLSWGIYLLFRKVGVDGLLGFDSKKVPRLRKAW